MIELYHVTIKRFCKKKYSRDIRQIPIRNPHLVDELSCVTNCSDSIKLHVYIILNVSSDLCWYKNRCANSMYFPNITNHIACNWFDYVILTSFQWIPNICTTPLICIHAIHMDFFEICSYFPCAPPELLNIREFKLTTLRFLLL